MEVPEISIVIPAYNAESLLPKLLKALEPWIRRSDVECIFVDDGSTDGTAEVLASIHGIILLESSENRGPAHARNRGVEAARGDVVFFIDADVIPQDDAIERVLLWKRERGDEVAVIGSYDAEPDVSGLVGQFKNLFHRFVHQTSREDAGTFWTGCGAVRRAPFLAMGGFDAEIYPHPSIEDIDLGVRLRHQGHRVRLDKDLLVKHRKNWGFWELVHTDVWRRGIPWTHLCLAYREMNADLNLRWENRLSVLLAGLLLVSPLFGIFGWLGEEGTAVFWGLSFAAYACLNRHLYGFMMKSKGVGFALKCIPLHLVYCLYCGVAFVLGVLTYPWAPIRARDGSTEVLSGEGRG